MACCTRNCSLLPFLSSSFSLVRRSFLQTQLRPLVAAGGSGCSQAPGLLLARHSSSENSSPGEKVIVNFVNQDGVKTTVSVAEGESLLDVVINKNLDISGFGACEGTLACSTCHLVFEENIYKKLEPALDEEIDMLDLSYGLTKTSRLGCQVCVQKWMEGMTVRVPQDVKDMRDSKIDAKPMTS